MDELLLTELIEKYVKGDMNASDISNFEELRKKNPEVDQLVVEHLFLQEELSSYADRTKFKRSLQETVKKLTAEGFITRTPPKGKAKLVHLWNRSKRTIAVAASIAGIVSIFSVSLLSTIHNRKIPNTKLLVEKINQQAEKTRRIENKVNQLAAASSTPVIIKPIMEAKFRATGFLIDVANNFIVTNAHVIKEAKNQLIVEDSKGEQFLAEAVYVNNENDLAILKVSDKDFKKLSPMPYSIKKTHADLGEQIYMLGYPKQEIVYAEGYVSAKNGYEMDTIYCQLSTSVNEGNSGSPVINKSGELVGIITSMETNASGVVFAIKSSNIYAAIEEVKKIKEHEKIKITSAPALKGVDRVSQIKKVQDYVFMIKGN